jgi:hypothetical protein
MKTRIEISGCFPVLSTLNTQQFINAIEPRLIDIRNPLTGLQIDMFGRVTAVSIEETNGIVTADIEISDAFLQLHRLEQEHLNVVLVDRITKLRHPATGAMTRVEARVINASSCK